MEKRPLIDIISIKINLYLKSEAYTIKQKPKKRAVKLLFFFVLVFEIQS